MTRGMTQLGMALICLWHAVTGAQPLSQQESERIWAEAKAAAQAGPAPIALMVRGSRQATLTLPEGHTYVPQPHATRVLNAMGNPGSDERLQGIVFPQGEASWFMPVRFERSGFIKDDDATRWDARELLRLYKTSTKAVNAERQQRGVAPIEILGWAHKPTYDASAHRLAWAMSLRDQGATSPEPQGANYNTFALGRDGYFSLNLVTDLSALPSHQAAAHTLLNALEFAPGKRYSDFNPTTDPVAAYGLTTLVVGAAASQGGVWGTVTVWARKFWKQSALVAALLGVGVFIWRKKRKSRHMAEDFAHTMLVERNAPSRTLPQPLAPHPHADQVWTEHDTPKAQAPANR